MATEIQCKSFRQIPHRDDVRANELYISVASSQPRDCQRKLGVFKALVPDWKHITELYKAGCIDKRTYTLRYAAQLDERKQAIREGLARYLDTHDATRTRRLYLVCWEGDKKFCHRHIARMWLLANCSDILNNPVRVSRVAV